MLDKHLEFSVSNQNDNILGIQIKLQNQIFAEKNKGKT